MSVNVHVVQSATRQAFEEALAAFLDDYSKRAGGWATTVQVMCPPPYGSHYAVLLIARND